MAEPASGSPTSSARSPDFGLLGGVSPHADRRGRGATGAGGGCPGQAMRGRSVGLTGRGSRDGLPMSQASTSWAAERPSAMAQTMRD